MLKELLKKTLTVYPDGPATTFGRLGELDLFANKSNINRAESLKPGTIRRKEVDLPVARADMNSKLSAKLNITWTWCEQRSESWLI